MNRIAATWTAWEKKSGCLPCRNANVTLFALPTWFSCVIGAPMGHGLMGSKWARQNSWLLTRMMTRWPSGKAPYQQTPEYMAADKIDDSMTKCDSSIPASSSENQQKSHWSLPAMVMMAQQPDWQWDLVNNLPHMISENKPSKNRHKSYNECRCQSIHHPPHRHRWYRWYLKFDQNKSLNLKFLIKYFLIKIYNSKKV